MSNYDITVIYARHNEEGDTPKPFPHQTYPAGKIQVIPVWEKDFVYTRRDSLKALSKAEGRFTILLDEEDEFDGNFLENMINGAKTAGMAFSMSAQIFPRVKRLVVGVFSLFANKAVVDYYVRLKRAHKIDEFRRLPF